MASQLTHLPSDDSGVAFEEEAIVGEEGKLELRTDAKRLDEAEIQFPANNLQITPVIISSTSISSQTECVSVEGDTMETISVPLKLKPTLLQKAYPFITIAQFLSLLGYLNLLVKAAWLDVGWRTDGIPKLFVLSQLLDHGWCLLQSLPLW